jgi:hypothetical protein
MADYSGFPILTPESVRERVQARLAEGARERRARDAAAPGVRPRVRLAGLLRGLAERLDGPTSVQPVPAYGPRRLSPWKHC